MRDQPANSPDWIDRVGHYVIQERLGHGAMGEVFVAQDEVLGRRVAVKRIQGVRALDRERRLRFLREARILSKLDHPHICRVYDYLQGEDGDSIVMELVPGQTLNRAMNAGLDVKARWRVATQMLDALLVAHSNGITHRDLKPANVMLTPDGNAKVLDFGLSQAAEVEESDHSQQSLKSISPASTTLTQEGQVVGTPRYMSPEQSRAERLTTASDLFSMGLILQELFGKTPGYPANLSLEELLPRVQQGRTTSASGVDRDLSRLIEDLKAPDPRNRPSAEAAAQRLRSIQDKPRRRRKQLLVIAGVVAMVLAWIKYTVDLDEQRQTAINAWTLEQVARTKAEVAQQRAQQSQDRAERLIGFMLEDLLDKLVPVGQVELLEDVGDEALEYFAVVPHEQLTTDEKQRKSQALQQIAALRADQGDLSGARTVADESLAIAREIFEHHPENEDYQFNLAQAEFHLGNVYYAAGDFKSALRQFELYQELSQALLSSDPDRDQFRREVASGLVNCGAILLKLGRHDDAEARLLHALDVWDDLIDFDPENMNWWEDKAMTSSWLAESYDAQGRFEEAADSYRLETILNDRILERRPDDRQWQYLQATAAVNLGDTLTKLGELENALHHVRKASTKMTELTEFDPNNADWQRHLAVSLLHCGHIQRRLGEESRARIDLERSRDLFKKLLTRHPDQTPWQDLLRDVERELALIVQ